MKLKDVRRLGAVREMLTEKFGIDTKPYSGYVEEMEGGFTVILTHDSTLAAIELIGCDFELKEGSTYKLKLVDMLYNPTMHPGRL